MHTRLLAEAVDVISTDWWPARSRSFFVREFVEGYRGEHGDELNVEVCLMALVQNRDGLVGIT